MYPVSATFKDKIKLLDQDLRIKVQIQHSQGVLNLDDSHMAQGGLMFEEKSQGGENFTVGGKSSAELHFEFFNKAEYDDLDLVGATVLPSVGLVLNLDEVDGEGNPVEPDIEWVPLGVFNVDEVTRTKTSLTVSISAFDNLILFDRPYALSQLAYPATVSQIFADLCSVCDVLPESVVFTNSTYQVTSRPEGDLTCRDVLGYVAELSGTFARATRAGKVELTWYSPSGLTLTGANRYNFVPRDDVVQITGVMATIDEIPYLAGTDTCAIDLSDNPLLTGNYETAIAAVYNAVKDTSFHAFESSWQGNPAVQAGDMLTQVDRDANEYPTIVTHSTYKYRGASTLAARGLPVTAKGFKGSTNRRIASIIRKVEAVVGDRLTSLEQATLHATEMIANMLGGHVIQEDDALYIADNEDLDLAEKVWKWGIGGFGYSSTGKDGPYTSAITADGTIVAMLVAAGIVTADMIQAGILQSTDGSSWFNLDSGHLNIKNKVYFDALAGKYVFDGKLSADTIEALKAEFDVTVSYTTITQVLYAERGNISELTVDQLDTSKMVANYLASDTSPIAFIRILDKDIEFWEGVVEEGTPPPTEQLKNRNGQNLYWTDASHTGVTTDTTAYPVMVYDYHLRRKLHLFFEIDSETGYAVPKMVWGVGNEVGAQKGYIVKDETGLRMQYEATNGKTYGICIGENGIQGVDAVLSALDFYSDGMIAEYDDGSVYDYSFSKDEDSRITEITCNTTGEVTAVNWHEGQKPPFEAQGGGGMGALGLPEGLESSDIEWPQ